MERLIGSCNEHHVIINGIDYRSLLDSGSMVTTISHSAFQQLKPKATILPLDSLGLSLSIADGSSLKYMGYFEANVSVPLLSSFSLDVPILVIPDNDFNLSCPVVIGTNVLRRCKYYVSYHGITAEEIPVEWEAAMQGIPSQTFCVKACNRRTVTVGPFETVTINGIARGLNNRISTVVTENIDGMSSYTVCPRVVKVNTSSSVKIPVRICNMTARTLSFKPKANLCEISQAKVIDDVTSYLPQDNFETPLEDLGFSIDTSVLTKEQLDRLYQVLGQWKHVFCTATKDIGKTSLVKHKIILQDETPFKQPYRSIPPAMFEEVRQHVRELLEAEVIRESVTLFIERCSCTSVIGGSSFLY